MTNYVVSIYGEKFVKFFNICIIHDTEAATLKKVAEKIESEYDFKIEGFKAWPWGLMAKTSKPEVKVSIEYCPEL